MHNQYPSVHLILHSFNDSDAYLPVITDTLLYKRYAALSSENAGSVPGYMQKFKNAASKNTGKHGFPVFLIYSYIFSRFFLTVLR